jgi:hypothetical protein
MDGTNEEEEEEEEGEEQRDLLLFVSAPSLFQAFEIQFCEYWTVGSAMVV